MQSLVHDMMADDDVGISAVSDQEYEIISDCDCDPDVEVISYIAEQGEEKAMLAAAEHMEFIVHDFMCFSDKAWLVPSWRQRLHALGLSPRLADAFIGQASEEAVLRCTGCQAALGEPCVQHHESEHMEISEQHYKFTGVASFGACWTLEEGVDCHGSSLLV